MEVINHDILYDAIVVASNLEDPGKIGSVRAKIIGLTDELDDNQQPWVQPAVNKTAKVPTVGTYLKVYFKNAQDQAFPVYLLQGISDGNYLPEEYRTGYPNITETDMGMFYFYNEATNEFRETDRTTAYERKVLPNGETQITTSNGYSYDTNNDRQENARVITEDMVNICTGRPIRQGTVLFKVPSFTEPEVQITGGTAAQQ